MLTGIHPLLVGPLLAQLDAMGHSDAVVLADAHFPAARVATRLLELPGVGTPALDLMDTPDSTRLPVQDELVAAAGGGEPRMLDRFAFYEEAQTAFLVVRTGETRTYGNAILRKGVVHV
jgi:L-fucose mutarotase